MPTKRLSKIFVKILKTQKPLKSNLIQSMDNFYTLGSGAEHILLFIWCWKSGYILIFYDLLQMLMRNYHLDL